MARKCSSRCQRDGFSPSTGLLCRQSGVSGKSPRVQPVNMSASVIVLDRSLPARYRFSQNATKRPEQSP
jgi:hypothetical protein